MDFYGVYVLIDILCEIWFVVKVGSVVECGILFNVGDDVIGRNGFRFKLFNIIY